MRFFSSGIWQGLELPDWRARFFIECYMESLSVLTPHFHQAKMMGVLDLAEEVLQNIQLFEENDKGKGYLVSSLKELKLALQADLVASEIFYDFLKLFEECVKTIETEKFPKSLIIQLSILCKRITNEKSVYNEKLKSKLLQTICDDTDITKKETITKNIQSLTRQYVTFLLNAGYSPNFLYNKSELLTRKTSYNGRIFRDQIQFLFSTLDCKLRDFQVFFGLKTNKKSTLQSYSPSKDVKILTEIPDKHFTVSTKVFSKFNPDFYLKVTVQALDYIGASFSANIIIEAELDFLKTFSNNINITIHHSCYADYKAKGNSYQRDLNLGLLSNLLTYDSSSTQLKSYLFFDFRTRLSSSSTKKIEGILQNFRQVKDSARLEQKLLNLWISLESLSYSGDDKSIISSLTSFLPKLYAIKSIDQRLSYVLHLLYKFDVRIPEPVIERHKINHDKFSQDLTIETFYSITTCTKSAQEICASITHLDFLYFRFYELHKLITDKKDIKTRIKNTKDSIENQLYRIYKKRNNIVHVGYSDNLNHYIINHLSDYVNILLLLVLEVTKNSKHLPEISLNDILLSTQLVLDYKFQQIEKDSITQYKDLELAIII